MKEMVYKVAQNKELLNSLKEGMSTLLSHRVEEREAVTEAVLEKNTKKKLNFWRGL